MKCKDCGKEIKDNSNYCPFCGKKQIREKKCTCERILKADFKFCPECGKKVEVKTSAAKVEKSSANKDDSKITKSSVENKKTSSKTTKAKTENQVNKKRFCQLDCGINVEGSIVFHKFPKYREDGDFVDEKYPIATCDYYPYFQKKNLKHFFHSYPKMSGKIFYLVEEGEVLEQQNDVLAIIGDKNWTWKDVDKFLAGKIK